MKNLTLFAALLVFISACSSAVTPTASPVLAEVDQAAMEQLAVRGPVEVGEAACNFGELNRLPHPNVAALAFAEGTWKVESSLDAGALGGSEGIADSIGISSIESVADNGFVEYYAGAWDGQLYLDTIFWGAVDGYRWAVIEANTASQTLSSLQGNYIKDDGFVMSGEMFDRKVDLILLPIDADTFDWTLTDAATDAVLWTKHYTRLTDESEAVAVRGKALAGLRPLAVNEGLLPLNFWIGEWNWYEEHIDLERDCAEGQASVTYTNGGWAIEERVVSSYDPFEANFPSYTDFTLAIFNAETQKFEVLWWTNGLAEARLYQGSCSTEGPQKECKLRATFMPSADENSIVWQAGGTRIDWQRK